LTAALSVPSVWSFLAKALACSFNEFRSPCRAKDFRTKP